MAIVGRNPRAGGSECIIFGHLGSASDEFEPITLDMRGFEAKGEELSSYGDWDVRPMRPGADLDIAPALVGANAQGDYCRTTGRLVLVSHHWSGILQIDNIGRKYKVDLYSETTRLVLLDVVYEIMVDVSGLSATRGGALRLPAMTTDRIFEHIVEQDAWFRFLDCDPSYRPGAARRAIEKFRDRPGERLKTRLLTALLPKLASRGPVALAPPPPPPATAPVWEDANRLRDELRCLAAAVDGLAQRAAARA